MIATINGADLFYETIGTGVPMLMMHGGLGLDHTYLRPWHDALADRARIIYYDHRWNGRSSRAGALDHATWHADAAALLDHVGERRAVIFGHSYGAWLALGFALRYPERVAGLALCGASPQFDYAPDLTASAQARYPDAVATLAVAFTAPIRDDAQYETMWRAVLPLYFFGPARPDVFANVRYSARAFAEGMACMSTFSTVPRLSSLDIPVLVMAGATDFIAPPAQGKRLIEHVPNGHYHEFASSGHLPFVEEHAAYLAAFGAWIGRDFRDTGGPR